MAALHECDCTCADERLGVYDSAVDFYRFLNHTFETEDGGDSWSTTDFDVNCGDGDWEATYSGSGTIDGGGAFHGVASGTVDGPVSGPITVTVDGTISGGSGSYTVAVSDTLIGSGGGTISGGVLSPGPLTITTPSGLTVTAQSPTFTAPGAGGAGTFDFGGTFGGTGAAVTVTAHDVMTISSMAKRGVIIERFNTDTGEKLEEWTNSIAPWRRGTCTLQMYRSYHNPAICAQESECQACLTPHTDFSMPDCDPDCSLYAIKVTLSGISDDPGTFPDCTAECAAWNGRTFILYPDPTTEAACRWTGGADFSPSCFGNFGREYNARIVGSSISIAWCDPSITTCHPWGVGGSAAFPGGVTADCDHLGSFGVQNLIASAAGGCLGTVIGGFNVIGTVETIPL